MKDINAFISAIKRNGVARPNRFWVMFNTPASVKTSLDLSEILLLCSGAQLPGMTISTTPNRTYGSAREVPYEKIYDPVTLTFIVDSKMKVKEYFDKWIGSVFDKETNDSNFYNDYTTDISIFLYDYSEQTSYYVLLNECYPKSIASIALESGDRNFMQMSVTLTVKQWYSKRLEGEGVDTVNISASDFVEDFINDFNGFQKNSSDLQSVFTGLGERINQEVSSLVGRGKQALNDITNKASQALGDLRNYFS